jgi:hypothetical protein
MNKTQIPLLLLIAVTASCSPEERVVEIATQAADRQAQQNQEMSRLNREVAQGTRQLVDADAQAREKFAEVHQQLQGERAELGQQWNALEAERKEIAQQRRSESMAVPIAQAIGVLLLVTVLIGFCWSLLFGSQKSEANAELGELLIHELSSDQPLLLPRLEQTQLPSLPNPEETSA